jgi:PAS domain S-box-containing protein
MSASDLNMKPVSSLYPDEEWAKIRSQNVRQKGMQNHIETKMIKKNQEVIDVSLSVSVLKGPDGNVTGSIAVISDIGEFKRLQEERDQLLRAARS